MSLKNNRSLGACNGPGSKGGSSASSSAAGSGSAPKSVRAADKQAPDRDQLLREQERIAKGEPLDQPLRSPKLRVTTAGLEVNGERLQDVALSRTEVAIEPALKSWLRLDREHVIMLIPDRPFTGNATIELASDLSAAQALSAVATVNHAGFDATVTVGASRFDSQAAGNTPLDVAELEANGSGWRLRFLGRVGCRLPKPAREVKTVDELRSAIRDSCEGLDGACANALRVVPSGDAATMASPLVAGFEALRERSPSVTLLAASGGAPPMFGAASPFAQCPGTGAKGGPFAADDASVPAQPRVPAASAGVVRWSAVSAQGPVDVPTLRAALPSLEPALLRCAALGRASNPNLVGRITVRGVVLRDGRVAQLQTTEADLPDAGVIACSIAATADLLLPAKPDGTTRFTAQLSFAPD
jgi:hypothetical protein